MLFRSIGAFLYVPIAALFFFIGTSLFAYYQTQPSLLGDVKRAVAAEQLLDEDVTPETPGYEARLSQRTYELEAADVGDKVWADVGGMDFSNPWFAEKMELYRPHSFKTYYRIYSPLSGLPQSRQVFEEKYAGVKKLVSDAAKLGIQVYTFSGCYEASCYGPEGKTTTTWDRSSWKFPED